MDTDYGGFKTTTFDSVVNWSRKFSLFGILMEDSSKCFCPSLIIKKKGKRWRND